MAYSYLKNDDPILLKLTSEEDEINELKHKTEELDHENRLEPLRIDNECYKQK